MLHCPDNDIVLIGIWHSMAVLAMALLAMTVLAMTGMGRVLLPRLIRW